MGVRGNPYEVSALPVAGSRRRFVGLFAVLAVILLIACGVVGAMLFRGSQSHAAKEQPVVSDVKDPDRLAELAGWDPAGEHGLYENVYREHPTNVQPGMKPGEEPLLEFKTVNGKPFNPCTPEVEARFADRGIKPKKEKPSRVLENVFNCTFENPFDAGLGNDLYIVSSDLSVELLEERNLQKFPNPYDANPDLVYFYPDPLTCTIAKLYEGGVFGVAIIGNVYKSTPEEGCEKAKPALEYVFKTLGVKQS